MPYSVSLSLHVNFTFLSNLLRLEQKHSKKKKVDAQKAKERENKQTTTKKELKFASLMHQACCPNLFPFALAQQETFLSGQRTPFAWAISKTRTDSPWQILPLHKPWEIAGWGWSRQRGVPAVTLARWARSIWRTKNQQWAVSGATCPSG